MDNMDLVELAPCMRPAGCLIDMVTVEMMKTSIGIRLQSAGEVLQMLAWMFSLAVLRVGEPNGGSGVVIGRPVVAHVGPKPASLGLAVAGCENRQRGIVSMDLAAGKDMLADRLH